MWDSKLSRSWTCPESFSWVENSVRIFCLHFMQTLVSIQKFFLKVYIYIRMMGQLDQHVLLPSSLKKKIQVWLLTFRTKHDLKNALLFINTTLWLTYLGLVVFWTRFHIFICSFSIKYKREEPLIIAKSFFWFESYPFAIICYISRRVYITLCMYNTTF